jgi:hypothetical protein
MATKKDLVEAYSFSRRRLVTAFVSGAPGGREVEPTKPGRAIIGGLALALLLVAAGAVLGILKSPVSVDWDQENLISEKESGALYLVLKKPGSEETEVRPLANITSAYLIFGSSKTTTKVPRKDISDKAPGDSIGILDAPQVPPLTSKLVQDHWTACTGVIGAGDPTGIKLRISPDPEDEVTPAPDSSFVVSTPSGAVYLVASSKVGFERGERAYTYPVPDTPGRSRLLGALAGTAPVVPVPENWVGLFPAGRSLSLETLGIDPGQYGKAWSGAASVAGAGDARIGDLLKDTAGKTYLVTPTRVIVLDDFALTLYRELDKPRGRANRIIEVDQGPGTVTDVSVIEGANWPTEVRNDNPPVDQLCAELDVQKDQPGVRLATVADGSPASSEDLDADDELVSVAPGNGAFVRSGDWTEGGDTSPFLIDPRGLAYLVGPGDEQSLLGYADVDLVVVPNAWIKLLGRGPALTVDAARCPPTSDTTQSSCS